MSAVVATAVAGWFLVLGGTWETGQTVIPVPYENQDKCARAGKVALEGIEGIKNRVVSFTCVPVDPDSVEYQD